MITDNIYEYISMDSQQLADDLSMGIESMYDMIDQVPFFYICKSAQALVLAHEIAHNKDDIMGTVQQGEFKVLSSLTISDALKNEILSNKTWEYSAENAERYLQQYKQA